jgi:hypothetical protein
MSYESYDLEIDESVSVFEFISEGPQGFIKKRVQFQKIIGPALHNLSFGDVNPETDKIDFSIVTNNNDTEKVLATVAATVYEFMDEYPEARVYIEGGSYSRTRLYRLGISNNLEEIKQTFAVYGYLEDEGLVVFEPNKNYLAFVIKKNK